MIVILLLLLIGFIGASEKMEVWRDIILRKEVKPLRELVEFRKKLEVLLEEEYLELPYGIKVRKGCELERGIASWYGGRFHGRRTANGEIYDLFKYTAASRTLPLDTYVLVINEENGKMITVRINDRGPYVDGRIIDLSMASAYKIGMMEKGISFVTVIPLSCLSPDTVLDRYDEIIADLINTF